MARRTAKDSDNSDNEFYGIGDPDEVVEADVIQPPNKDQIGDKADVAPEDVMQEMVNFEPTQDMAIIYVKDAKTTEDFELPAHHLLDRSKKFQPKSHEPLPNVEELTNKKKWELALKLYVLADKLEDEKSINMVIREIHPMLSMGIKVPLCEIQGVYDITVEGSALRRLVVDYFRTVMLSTRLEKVKSKALKAYPVTFLMDVVLAAKSRMDHTGMTSKTLSDVSGYQQGL